MSAPMRPLRRGAAVLAALLLGLALPTPVARADNCQVFTINLCAFGDDLSIRMAQVPFMELLWSANRRALLLARWLEGLHDWLAADVLDAALDVTLGAMRFPFWLLVAVAAVVFVVTYLAQVLLVRVRLVDAPRALGVVLLASVLFQAGLPGLAAVEGLRVGLVAGFGGIAQQVTLAVGAPLFYVTDDGSAAAPHAIYAADACGLALKRATSGVHVNDLTANFLWAEAEDIHCPPGDSSLPDLPRQFRTGDGAGFDGYLPVYPLDVVDDAERARLVAATGDGTNRLLTTLIALALPAVLEPLWHLLLLLALATTGLALIVALPAGLFVPLAGLLQEPVRGLIAVFQTSAISSFWVGLTVGLLRLAAGSGNAEAVAVVGLLAGGVFGWQCVQAAFLAGRALSIGAGAVGVSVGELGRAGAGVGQSALNTGLVGAALATGGAGALAGQLLRRGLATAGSGAAGATAGRVLAGQVPRWQADWQSQNAELADAAEIAWYNRQRYEGAGTPEGDARAAARVGAAGQDLARRQIARLEQQATHARSRGDFRRADVLDASIARLRAGGSAAPSVPVAAPPPAAGGSSRPSGPSSPGVAPARRRGGGAGRPAASAPATGGAAGAPAASSGARSRFMRRTVAQEQQAATAQAETARQQRQAEARQQAAQRAARRRPPPAPPTAGQPLSAEEIAFFQAAEADAADAATFDALLPPAGEEQP